MVDREIRPAAEYARWFASQGGKARSRALSPKERRASAKKAALACSRGTTREERREVRKQLARARRAKAKKTKS